MEFLSELWLAILLSAVFVFIASSILHMVIPIHKNDFKKLGNEDSILEAMRSQGVQPGQYMFPGATRSRTWARRRCRRSTSRGRWGS